MVHPNHSDGQESDQVMPIAIIGMACRFPGDGEDVESLFDMLKRGDNAWSEFPDDRVNIDGFYHPSGSRQGSIGFRGAHFIKGDIKAFDAAFFNISPTEAPAIDPQQRVLLETTYQALENAGYSKEALDLSETSVNVGTFVKDYEQVVLRDSDWAPQYAATGTGNAILANRISYQFNLRGPSQTVDTGCSASLVGVHNGAQDLRTGRADLAIAAGVGMILTPATMMPMTALNFLGKDGKCYTFTDKAEGYGRGEGVGVVVLKRLSDAIRDNDSIRAVIRGSRVNQDGRTPGITMPSAEAQLHNIRSVYKEAGLTVDKTAYVECHGTGTPAGDPKESFAVSQAFCSERDADKPILIGSLKPNIGHLEGAAGVAGLIKATMAVERGLVPKNLYFDMSIANPNIKFDEWKVKVPTELTPWPMDGLRRASVNCFGFGGTNAHIILDDVASYCAERGLVANHRSVLSSAAVPVSQQQKTFADVHVFLISSHERDGVSRITEGHAPFVASHAADDDLLANYAYTLSRRSRLEFKTYIVAATSQELASKLADTAALNIQRSAEDTAIPKLAMVFCGQGAQWYAMGRELLSYEPFANSLVGASKYLSKIVGSDFDLLKELRHETSVQSRIHAPKFAQPATTAVQVALVDLCKASNIIPDAVVGHSSGEIAAAYAAGYITREDAWLIAYRRGQFASLIEFRSPLLKGSMMAVGLGRADAEAYVSKAASLHQGTICVACENSPVSVTLSGDQAQILLVADMLEADDVFHRILKVQTAYHSVHMRMVEHEYRQSLKEIVPKTNPEGPKMFSSVTGHYTDGAILDGSYWADNLVSPVLFNQAFSAMYEAIKPKVVLEVSPSITLYRPVQEIMRKIKPNKKKDLVCIPLLKCEANASVTALEAFGEMWSRGLPVTLNWAYESKEGHLPQLVVDLPPYPFNHSKAYWFESHLGTALRFRKHGREDLIGAPLAEATPQEPRWRGFFRMGENPWLSDHQVQKTIIYPAAGLLTMALEAARQCTDITLAVDTYQISNFNIIKPVIIPAGEHGLEHMLNAKILKVPSHDAAHCSAVYSFSIVTKTEHGQWQENADGLFTIFYCGKATDLVEKLAVQGEEYKRIHAKLRTECTQNVNPRTLYERLDGIGMNYGPLFQNIVALSKSQDACTSVVRIPDTKSKMPAQYEYDHLIHPATLDAMFQTVFSIGDTSMVPSFVRQITLSPDMLRGAGAEFHGYATAQLKGYREAEADIVMSDKTFSKPMVTINGMQFIKISSDASGFLPSDRSLCSEMLWTNLGDVPPYDDGVTNFSKFGPIVLLVRDDFFAKTMNVVARLGAVNANMECVRLSELDPSHMKELCISFLEFEAPFMFDLSPDQFAKVQTLIKLTSGLLWLTFGGKMAEEDPQMAPFQGLARSIRSEDSSRRIVTLDIKNNSSTGLDTVKTEKSVIRSVFTTAFGKKSYDDDSAEYPEVEYAFRDGQLWGPRLAPVVDLNAAIENGKESLVSLESVPIEEADGPLEFKIGKVADVTTSYFVKDLSASKSLGPNDVRISVESTHLFPIDYDTMMGRSSETALGADVLGQVTETGANVADLPVGSLVVALARNTIRTSITLDRSFVHQLHDRSTLPGLSPTALTTAYHGLVGAGNLMSGDTVFVNRAAGPYGDAVLRVSKVLGLNIFAGHRDNKERDFLYHNYGIPLDHMVDTTMDRFPEEIMRLTAGSGVDFFFSPTPDHLEASAQCVAANGHLFLVLNTNAPLSKSALIPQHANISFHKFDLFGLIHKRPRVFARAWAEVLDMVVAGKLGKCPDSLIYEERVHHLDQLWENVGTAPGRQLNRVTFTDHSIVRVGKNLIVPASLDPKGAYVLVGGLGGLGKAIATLMADRGARCLVFLSRSGAKTNEDQQFLSNLERRGVMARALCVDVCDKDDLQRTLTDSWIPPIKGVVQCAAVIADAIFEHMTYAEWKSATRPKMLGSLNLHEILPNNLDFFIMLSSASGIIGNRGQGNYAAGNVFQDALARFRTANGQASYSIDLGPVMGAGMLENDAETCAILKSSGFFMVMLDNFLFIVERAMCPTTGTCAIRMPAQVVTGVGTGGLIAQNEVSDPFWAETKMFEILNKVDEFAPPADSSRDGTPSVSSSFYSLSSQGSGRSLLHGLKHAESAEEAGEIVTHGCINYLSVSLSMHAEDMDSDKSLTAYGVDSLVTSSFRSWIFKNLGVKVTDMEVIGAASIAELGWSIAEKGGWGV